MYTLQELTEAVGQMRHELWAFEERIRNLEQMAHPEKQTVDPASFDDALWQIHRRLEQLEEALHAAD